MAVLSDQRRAAATQEFMEQLSSGREPTLTLLKADMRPVINAIDDYLNTNAATINAALPQPARTVLSQDQKARALTLVVAYRYLDKA